MATRLRTFAALALGVPLTAALLASGCVSRKLAPTAVAGDLHIVSISADPNPVPLYGESTVQAAVDNPNGGAVEYTWTAYRGSVAGNGPTVHYFSAYCCSGTDFIGLIVRNDRGEQDTKIFPITVNLQP